MSPFLKHVKNVEFCGQCIVHGLLCNVVGNVHHFLFWRIETQHLHGGMQVTGVDCCSSQPGLKGPEDGRDAVHLLVSQHVVGVGHVGADPYFPTRRPTHSALDNLVLFLLLGSNLLRNWEPLHQIVGKSQASMATTQDITSHFISRANKMDPIVMLNTRKGR